MPRFFFHVFDDAEALDEEGLELPCADAAMREALRSARSLAAEQVGHGRLCLHHLIKIEDESGAAVATVAFGDAVTVETSPWPLSTGKSAGRASRGR